MIEFRAHNFVNNDESIKSFVWVISRLHAIVLINAKNLESAPLTWPVFSAGVKTIATIVHTRNMLIAAKIEVLCA